MPQKRKATMMDSNKTLNYHIREIIYNLYKDDIFQNKKEIKFVSITAMYFIKDTEKFGHCMDLINDAVKPYHIETLKKKLDKVELKNIVITLMISSL